VLIRLPLTRSLCAKKQMLRAQLSPMAHMTVLYLLVTQAATGCECACGFRCCRVWLVCALGNRHQVQAPGTGVQEVGGSAAECIDSVQCSAVADAVRCTVLPFRVPCSI
jgi:hypothetical protein